MSANRSLISPTSNSLLEQALRDKLKRRSEITGNLGELEPLAVRIGLIQNTLKPRFESPQLALFAADHGLAVDGVCSNASGQPSTASLVQDLLGARLPVSVFARIQGMALNVVDCGVAESVAAHPRLLARKIAHGTRNLRVTSAMSLDQAHAAIRAGMEIADALAGNVIACAGMGIGSHESAALVLSGLSGDAIRGLVMPQVPLSTEADALLTMVMTTAQGRHGHLTDAVEVLAACGGFEIAMMVGVMLVAASKRHLIMVDGLPACAALMAASRIAPTVTDYCVFCRSHSHPGLTQALSLFHAMALLELGMESTDGTGATLAYPLVRSAAALLTDVAEGEDPGPSLPAAMNGLSPGGKSAVLR
jgi:nicotinate-nucleotide--dimethylbenzimidazole phosphoribosyltransferase